MEARVYLIVEHAEEHWSQNDGEDYFRSLYINGYKQFITIEIPPHY